MGRLRAIRARRRRATRNAWRTSRTSCTRTMAAPRARPRAEHAATLPPRRSSGGGAVERRRGTICGSAHDDEPLAAESARAPRAARRLPRVLGEAEPRIEVARRARMPAATARSARRAIHGARLRPRPRSRLGVHARSPACSLRGRARASGSAARRAPRTRAPSSSSRRQDTSLIR